ncbi:MAG: hypothetical protein AAF430_08730 [Myxococcota bacterium]
MTVLAASPLWFTALPPLQDYAYHLAQVEILEADAAAFPAFERDLGFRPYAAFYALTSALSGVLPVETAGRLVVTLYFVLLAGVLAAWAVEARRPLWPGLALLPFAAIQPTYVLGFLNYQLAMPFLLGGLWVWPRFARRPSVATASVLAACIVGLFTTHPFSYLVFLGFAGLRLVWEADLRARVAGWGAWTLATAIFAAWFLAADGGQGASGPEGVQWLGVAESLRILALPFLGMHADRIDPVVATLWWVWFTGLAWLWWRAPERVSDEARYFALACAIATLATLVFPFRMGHYSYINARMPGVAMLCLAMAIAPLRVPRPWAAAHVLLLCAALGVAVAQQRRVGEAMDEVLPLLEQVPRDAALLPLVFDPYSDELDPRLFAPFLHIHHAVHVLQGGGVTPYFFPHPLAPVRYAEGQPPLAPPQYRPGRFELARHAGYDHWLLRSPPPRAWSALSRSGTEIARSGDWVLLRREPSAAPAEQSPTPPSGS